VWTLRDIQEATGRALIVYFSGYNDTRAQILAGDDSFFMEMIRDANGRPADLLIETPGGATDTTEKIATLLRTLVPDLRVIVPCRAKSNGTLLALVGAQIVMGVCSELGPADPLVSLSPSQAVPAQFLLSAQNVDPIFVQAAAHAVRQTEMLANKLLSTGMMKGRNPKDIEVTVKARSSRERYPSHGSVIDADEATRLGLNVKKLPPEDELWQQIWLLRCMYEYDLAKIGGLKIFEGLTVSNVLKTAVAKP
jgi:serine dehydrogenase proteinase